MVVCLHVGYLIVALDCGALGWGEAIRGLGGYCEGVAIGCGHLAIGQTTFPSQCDLVIIQVAGRDAEFDAAFPFLNVIVGMFLLFDLARQWV